MFFRSALSRPGQGAARAVAMVGSRTRGVRVGALVENQARPVPAVSSLSFSGGKQKVDYTVNGARGFHGGTSISTLPGWDVSSRMIELGDANFAGNAHGGRLVHMMTQSAYAAGMRWINGVRGPHSGHFDLALATLAATSFHAPVHIGDSVDIRSRVELTTNSTVQINVELYAENLFRPGEKRLCNSTTVWFVAIEKSHPSEIVVAKGVPLFPGTANHSGDVAVARNEQRRNAQALEQSSQQELLKRFDKSSLWNASLAKIVGQGDVRMNSFATGGMVIKLMDEAAALSCLRHSRASNCVTASMDVLSFVKPLLKGQMVCVQARPTFASGKSLEIEIIVQGEDMSTGEKHITAHGHFIFVALDANGKALPMPPLDVEPDADAIERNKQRKAARASKS